MSGRRPVRKRLLGLTALSFGLGMLIVIVVPGWGFVFAAGLVGVGVWCLLG